MGKAEAASPTTKCWISMDSKATRLPLTTLVSTAAVPILVVSSLALSRSMVTTLS